MMKRLLIASALLGLLSPVAQGDPLTAKDMPYLHVMLLRAQAAPEQIATALSQLSLASSGTAYLLPAGHAQAEQLLQILASIHPKVLADTDVKPSLAANTAMDAVVENEGLRIRTKTTSISGERLKLWLGIERSTADGGPTNIVDRTSIPAEIAYGEAFVTTTASGLIVAIIPGAFDSVEEPPEPDTSPAAEGRRVDQTLDEPHRIIWDTAAPDDARSSDPS